MKPVDIIFKKIDVRDYYPQLDQVVFRVLFNDGSDKQLIKQVQIKNPQQLVQDWFTEIRDKLKESHSVQVDDDNPLAGHVILRFQQDQDVILEKMSRFVNSVKEQITSSKLAKMSYYDIDRKVRGCALRFDGSKN